MTSSTRAATAAAFVLVGLAVNLVARVASFPARNSLIEHNVALALMVVCAVVGCACAIQNRQWPLTALLVAGIGMQIVKLALAYDGHDIDHNRYNVYLAAAYAADILLLWIPATATAIIGASLIFFKGK